MPVVTLTTTSGSPQTWTVPSDAPVGTVLTVECWGAGSGGSGSSTSFRAGGAGGAWAKSLYTVTPHDVASGISFTQNTGSAGTGAANSTAGTDTSFSTNNINKFADSINTGTVVGTPGTLPTGWSYSGNPSGLTTSVVAFGTDLNSGFPYADLRVNGTPGANGNVNLFFAIGLTSGIATSTAYNESFYTCYQDGGGSSLTNVTTPFLQFIDGVSFAGIGFANFTWTTALTRTPTCTGSTTTNANVNISMGFVVTSGAAIDITFRIAGLQFEAASSASFWKSSPGYTLAKGGGATSGTTGGVGGATATSIGTVAKNAGGSGATRTQGGGGGGSAGKDGAGTSATTGTGGTGDAGSGGAANTSNIEGGGGGTAAVSANAGGAPGGGGGAATTTNSGAAGGRGQVRITYTGASYGPTTKPWKQRRMLLR